MGQLKEENGGVFTFTFDVSPLSMRFGEVLMGSFADCQGWSRNSSSPPARPWVSQCWAVSLRTGRELRKVTRYLGKANGSSARA